ncbi:MAG: hypothetical protein KDK39_02115 [Leptospiraceae bacterium]|nr:hypothetical protein [Leptospiraceae bacterium]
MRKTKKMIIFTVAAYAWAACLDQAAPARDGRSTGGKQTMQITIKAKDTGQTILFNLNDSQAARDLVQQLPITTTIEDYGSNEKIFYPPLKLNTADTPLAKNIRAGTLAWYAPWGDVVLFYDTFRSANGLYALGQAASGTELIQRLSGTIQIEAVDRQPESSISGR